MHHFPRLVPQDGHPMIACRIPKACEITGVSRSALYELIKKNEIEVAKIGRTTLVLVASLQALIDRNTKKAA